MQHEQDGIKMEGPRSIRDRGPSSVSVTLGFPVRGSPLLRHTVTRELSTRTPPRQDFDCIFPLDHLLYLGVLGVVGPNPLSRTDHPNLSTRHARRGTLGESVPQI